MTKPVVIFTKETHKYEAEGRFWDSANKIKDFFFPAFEEDYWKYYKAVELMLPDFKERKSKLRYPFNAQPKIEWLNEQVQEYTQEEIQGFIQIIDDRWKASRDNGTIFHDKIEKQEIEQGVVVWDGMEYEVQTFEKQYDNQSIVDDLRDLKPGAYHEIILFKKIGTSYILGTADRVLIPKTKDFSIIQDHKTINDYSCKKGKKLYPPFDRLDTGKHCGYSIQTSLYGYLLDLSGLPPKHLQIFSYNDYDESTRKVHDCRYYKPEIEKMINIYRDKIYGDIDF